ncbi:RNA 2'-phosphotransferase [Enterococcus sp. LJL128]
MLTKQEEKISKTISYALRHKPEEFDLILDEEGYVAVKRFIEKMNCKENLGLTEELLLSLLARSDKKRWEIKDEKIRAIYGHSIKKKIEKTAAVPPQFLYHGTAHRFTASILEQGLIPKERQYVHLSSDIETAVAVGKRRDRSPVLFKVNAEAAFQDGIKFYREPEEIWLSDRIPADYLQIITE